MNDKELASGFSSVRLFNKETGEELGEINDTKLVTLKTDHDSSNIKFNANKSISGTLNCSFTERGKLLLNKLKLEFEINRLSNVAYYTRKTVKYNQIVKKIDGALRELEETVLKLKGGNAFE